MKKLSTFFSFVLIAFSSLGVMGQAAAPCADTDNVCKINTILKKIQTDPKEPENYYNLGLAYRRSGNFKQAVELYSMYIAIPGIKPEYLADGYNNRGMMRRKLNQPELAAADFTKAMELNPAEPAFVSNRGNANSDIKKYDAALADYSQAIRIKPSFALAYSGRGHLYMTLGKTAEAILDFTSAISYDPAEPEAYYNRGVVYGIRKEYAKAIPDYDKYIELLPGDPIYLADGYLNRGIAHWHTGSNDQAIKDFTKVILLDPQNARGYRARAAVYRETNNAALALADEKKAADLAATK